MKKYNVSNYVRHKSDLKVNRGHELDSFLPHVITIAHTFPTDATAIGILDVNDLIQAGHIGLIEAWARVDWDRLGKSPNPKGELWSFLKIRVKGAIVREIDKHSSFISRPIHLQEKRRSNHKFKGADRVLVSMFGSFFDSSQFIRHIEDPAPFVSILLEELIDDELTRVVHSVDHRDILKKFYGIGFDEMTQKELAEKYKTNHGNIQKIVQRTKDKLKNDTFKNIIETFYENMS